MSRWGSLGNGAAMSDAEIDDLIAKEDPKSSAAQQTVQVQQQRMIASNAAQVAAAKKRAFITGGVVGALGLLAYFHYRDK